MLYEDLVDIGLSEKEALVYLAVLELGQANIQAIATKAKINRTTAYVIIDQLIKIGLASSFYKGKKQFYVASSPDRLLEIINISIAKEESKKEKVEKLLPQLTSLNSRNDNKPVVKYYEGKEGIKAMMIDWYETARGLVKMIYSEDAVAGAFSQEERKGLIDRRLIKKIKVLALYTQKEGVHKPVTDGELIKIPEDKFQVSADIAICGDRIRLTSLKNKFGGIIIENKEIAKSIEALFDLAWEDAKKYKK